MLFSLILFIRKFYFLNLLNERCIWTIYINASDWCAEYEICECCKARVPNSAFEMQKIPCVEQLATFPGSPLIVWESETFGANPDFRASLMIASVSDFHHSPTIRVIFEGL